MGSGDSTPFASEVASRIRELIAGQRREETTALARRLRVDEESLRCTINGAWPRPSLAVILAIVREFGVDPCWLLTGDYDLSTHRRVIELDRPTTIEEVRLLARRRTTPEGILLSALLVDDAVLQDQSPEHPFSSDDVPL